jgi:acetyl esterase/lipase
MSEPTRIPYGPHPAQFGELWRPSRVRHPGVVVVIHGGFWRAAYDLEFGRPLAADLATRGFVSWNIEYRRVGAGGGWPTTLDDVAAAIDHLARLDVDTSRVVTIGHSAGGHLATWAAGRRDARVPVTGVIAQAGVLDLDSAAHLRIGNGAVLDFLGGGPDEVAERYAAADPIAALPISAPVLCVHARADDTVPFTQSETYVARAIDAGGSAELRDVPGDHFSVIDPTDAAWSMVVDTLPRLLNA